MLPRPHYWFRPKSFGYGATPVTWQGWLFTLGSAAVTTGALLIAVAAELHQWPNRRLFQAAGLAIAALSPLLTIVIARQRTDGVWRWRP